MLLWIISLAVGAAAALWLYGWRLPSDGYRRGLAALRAVAVALTVALLLDAPLGARVQARPLTALDASASWRQGNSARFTEAAARAKSTGGDLQLFGDSLSAGGVPSTPSDAASRVGPAVDRSAALGRPLHVITDGQLDDPEALDALPAGSTVEVLPAPDAVDVAVRSLDLPLGAAPGDSIEVRALVVSGGARVPAASIAVRSADGAALAAAALGALEPWNEREWRGRIKVPDRRDALILRVAVTAAGDVEHRNDTLTTAVEVRSGPSAVFASTSPDQDARFALDLMRGALGFGVRGYVRVAPGQWRDEGTLSRVDEPTVRDALARAPIAVLQGDTALFGPPRTLTRGALALVVPPRDDDGEYFTEPAGASPLAPALTGVAWDSLPPIAVGTAPIGTSWIALGARRGRRFDERVVVAGYDSPRRVAVLPVRGLWRWKFRGGRSADAFAALWGGVFDWLAEGGADERAAFAASPWVREGEPISWRRGSARDSVVAVRLRRDGDTAITSVTLRFSDAASLTSSPPLVAGVWRASVAGGSAVIAVNPSAEWVPRRPIVSRVATGGTPAVGARPSLRDGWWWFALVLAMLCAEWWMRRRVGLR
ncbi:MAG: hypothetical protein HYV19_02495 [Gemmatimonadetes bacterium]|nr:hypothetical protein [Gemmatimonadota bacterium]